jgi:hypothetical protein
MTTYNTNLASEFYVLSMLHRFGCDASLTLGNKKSVDIVVVPAEIYVIPSKQLAPLVYHSPNGKRHVLQLSRMRKDGVQFRNAWELLK